MKSICFIIAVSLLFISGEARSQNKKVAKTTKKESVNQAHKRDFETRAERNARRVKSRKYNTQEAFYKRMEFNSKEQLRNEKRGMNPRYSDKNYFGHKRPPKKRSIRKMKYCKVCGIKH